MTSTIHCKHNTTTSCFLRHMGEKKKPMASTAKLRLKKAVSVVAVHVVNRCTIGSAYHMYRSKHPDCESTYFTVM